MEDLTLEELFNKVHESNDDKAKPEKISTILNFFNEIKDECEPAMFILNVGIKEGIFRPAFDFIFNLLTTTNSFESFNVLGSCFMNNIATILTVNKNCANLIFNPKHLSVGKFNNNFFDIEVVNTTPNTQLVKDFVETSQFNFRSYIKTVTEKVKFSYSTRRDIINNKKVNPTISSIGDQYIITEKVRNPNTPWLSTNKIIKFKILIDGEKCISGGRPGIPGSVYLTLFDRTSIILFKKGTCLIVGSKVNQKRTLVDFVKKTFNNLYFLVNIFVRFSQSVIHKEIVTNMKLTKCEKCLVADLTCDECLRVTAIKNEIEGMREKNINVEYLRCYNEYYTNISKESSFLKNLCVDVIDNNSIEKIIKVVDDFIELHPDSILSQVKVAVFGLRKKEVINSGIFLQMPLSHRRNVSLFNGNRITYRSLKNTTHAKNLIELYNAILIKIKASRQKVGNIFQYEDDKLFSMVDDFTNLFSTVESSNGISLTPVSLTTVSLTRVLRTPGSPTKNSSE